MTEKNSTLLKIRPVNRRVSLRKKNQDKQLPLLVVQLAIVINTCVGMANLYVAITRYQQQQQPPAAIVTTRN